MSDGKRSLTDLCGGRFGIVPAAVSDSPDIANGPFRLYAVLCARAKADGTCKICLKHIAEKLGVSPRTMQQWKRKLELLGWVEQLHHGDKAIGNYRIIRNLADRNPVRLRNAIKVGIRSAAKTPHAKKAAHPRCEENCAYNKKKNRTLLNLPTEPAAEESSPNLNPNQALQGNAVAAKSGLIYPTPGKPKRRTSASQPDWQSWARWLAATRAVNEEKAWLWLMEEVDRLADEHGISPEDAGWILRRRLSREKESGQ